MNENPGSCRVSQRTEIGLQRRIFKEGQHITTHFEDAWHEPSRSHVMAENGHAMHSLLISYLHGMTFVGHGTIMHHESSPLVTSLQIVDSAVFLSLVQFIGHFCL